MLRGLSKHVAQEDASAVVDPTQAVAKGDDGVCFPAVSQQQSCQASAGLSLLRIDTRMEFHLSAGPAVLEPNKHMSA
jgi:hypothetical protein